jgi:hypothetical protein
MINIIAAMIPNGRSGTVRPLEYKEDWKTTAAQRLKRRDISLSHYQVLVCASTAG